MSGNAEVNIGDVLDELNIAAPEGAAGDEGGQQNQDPGDAGKAGDKPDENADGETETVPDEEQGDDSESPDDADGEESDDESDDAADDEAGQEEKEARAVKKLTKRVDRLTARAKTAEEEVEAYKAKLTDAEARLEKAQPIVLQDAADILGDVTTTEDLDARVANANTVLDQVPELLATADADGEVEIRMSDGSVKTFSADDLRARLRAAREIVKGEGRRREFIALRGKQVEEAKVEYPELFKDGHPARAAMLDTLKQYPALAKMPGMELAIGDMLNGYLLRMERAKAAAGKTAGKPAAKPAAAAAEPAKPKVAPSIPKQSSQSRQAPKPAVDALANLKKSGSMDAAEALAASLLG